LFLSNGLCKLSLPTSVVFEDLVYVGAQLGCPGKRLLPLSQEQLFTACCELKQAIFPRLLKLQAGLLQLLYALPLGLSFRLGDLLGFFSSALPYLKLLFSVVLEDGRRICTDVLGLTYGFLLLAFQTLQFVCVELKKPTGPTFLELKPGSFPGFERFSLSLCGFLCGFFLYRSLAVQDLLPFVFVVLQDSERIETMFLSQLQL